MDIVETDCPICLDTYDQDTMAQVCSNGHRVCHDCFGATMAADGEARRYGNKTGCYCGERYYEFGADHPAPETLPREFRLRVREALELRASIEDIEADQGALGAAQLFYPPVSDPNDYESDTEYPLLDGVVGQGQVLDWAYDPQPFIISPVFQNGIRDDRAPDRIGHKRTIDEMDNALEAITDDHTRAWKSACRDWNRENGKLRTRIWRARRKNETAEAIQELQLKLSDWNTEHPKPRRDEFAPALPVIPEGPRLADISI